MVRDEQGTICSPPASFWKHPRRVWTRRATFQIHLWVGILLCVYCVAIGFSGSVLVFADELARINSPSLMRARTKLGGGVDGATLERATRAASARYPEWQVESVYAPGVRGENIAVLLSKTGKYRYVYVSASAIPLGDEPLDQGWLNWVADLHFRLLAGPMGLIVNGVAAAFLLLLCVTGIVIWWPGVKTWKYALRVDFRRRWKRVNFDLHSAVGFWTLTIMSMWAVSGIYFVWPQHFAAAVNLISKAPNAVPPVFHLSKFSRTDLPLQTLVLRAHALEPATKLQGVIYASAGQPLTVLLAPGDLSEFTHTSWIYLDGAHGGIIGLWHPGRRESLGDWFIWLQSPLHFGTTWGFAGKIVWSFLGIMLPLLAVSGVLMYWNRYLSKRWRTLRELSRTL